MVPTGEDAPLAAASRALCGAWVSRTPAWQPTRPPWFGGPRARRARHRRRRPTAPAHRPGCSPPPLTPSRPHPCMSLSSRCPRAYGWAQCSRSSPTPCPDSPTFSRPRGGSAAGRSCCLQPFRKFAFATERHARSEEPGFCRQTGGQCHPELSPLFSTYFTDPHPRPGSFVAASRSGLRGCMEDALPPRVGGRTAPL